MPRIHRYSPLTSSQHVTRPAPAKELNTRRCPVCKAKAGEACFVLTGTRFIELKKTHTAQRKKPAASPPVDDGAPRKTSTGKLDREYAWKQARQGVEARRRNGG